MKWEKKKLSCSLILVTDMVVRSYLYVIHVCHSIFLTQVLCYICVRGICSLKEEHYHNMLYVAADYGSMCVLWIYTVSYHISDTHTVIFMCCADIVTRM